MKDDRLIRVIAAVGAAAIGIVFAAWAGAPLVATVVAVLAGIFAALLLPRNPSEPAIVTQSVAETVPAPPTLQDFAEAADEPLLIVRGRKVLIANRAARALLGEHVGGVDVRLALRHPAAADRLAGEGMENGAGDVEIVGLGEAGRPWLMQVRSMGDGARLVRLIDQGASRAAEQMRVDFVANASHELRTPLATLLGFLETLEDEEAASDPETRNRFINIMAAEATRMRDLVDDLMSLSRVEAERFSAPRQPVDLRSLIDEVRGSLSQLITSRRSDLVIEHGSDRAIVAGDRPQLAQMLTNLVANALKYGRAGRPVRIRLAAAGDGMTRLTVIDEGDGIAPEHLPRLTERFYRVDASRSRQAGGTGLGLAIVKHIVLRHRGRLDIASTLGTGTEVTVHLPLADVTEESRS